MKNFFISILLLTSFSASLFAADEIKAVVLTPKIQLELAVLYGIFSAAGAILDEANDDAWGPDWEAAWDLVRLATIDTAGGAAGEAIWNAAWDAIGDAGVNAAAKAAALIAAHDAVQGRAKKGAVGSWIVVIEKFNEIQEEVQLKTKGKFKQLTPQGSAVLYHKVIQRFMKSFENPKYKQMLDSLKTLYVVNLARIFPKVGFEARSRILAVLEAINKNEILPPQPVRGLIADYFYCYNLLDQKVLHAYVLSKLKKL